MDLVTGVDVAFSIGTRGSLFWRQCRVSRAVGLIDFRHQQLTLDCHKRIGDYIPSVAQDFVDAFV